MEDPCPLPRSELSSIPRSLVLSWNKMIVAPCVRVDKTWPYLENTQPSRWLSRGRKGTRSVFQHCPLWSWHPSLSTCLTVDGVWRSGLVWGRAIRFSYIIRTRCNYRIFALGQAYSRWSIFMQHYMNLENNQAFPDAPEGNLTGLLPDTSPVLCCWDGLHCFSSISKHPHSVLWFHLKLHFFPGD